MMEAVKHLMPDEFFIARCRELYRSTLLDDIVPFWMRHGFDREYGGIGNILDDTGQVLGHDKYLWSQGRALWTFSALYNRVQPQPAWLEFAAHIYRYLTTHGRDAEGRWMYRLSSDGEVLERDESIYVDGFALAGLSEYFVATGDRAALDLALATYENTRARLQRPGSYKTAPYEIPPGLKAHGPRMIFAFFYYNLGEVSDRDDIRQAGLELAHEILDDFYVADKDAILEFVAPDGSFVNSPAGRACVPGHGLEALWFLISIFERAGEMERIPLCCRLIRRHLELAWDDEYGGLKLALDIEGQEPIYWQKADCKPWWVQVEALVATAYAHVHSREAWCLEWHQRVQEWAFAHYPVEDGEWTQWVDRTGRKMSSAALPVKDPFHLPRALIYLIELFETRM
jgi:N-acylglucosamine 2-epimerase